MVTSSNLSTIAILFNDCRMGVSLLTTAATRSYQYRATDALPLYAMNEEKPRNSAVSGLKAHTGIVSKMRS